MKRSEMVDIIQEHIVDCMGGTADLVHREITEEILIDIERAGMLPPFNEDNGPYTKADADGYEWEKELSKEQEAILDHTQYKAHNKVYCGGSSDMNELIKLGFMEFVGKKPFTSDNYYTITKKGIEALKGKRKR